MINGFLNGISTPFVWLYDKGTYVADSVAQSKVGQWTSSYIIPGVTGTGKVTVDVALRVNMAQCTLGSLAMSAERAREAAENFKERNVKGISKGLLNSALTISWLGTTYLFGCWVWYGHPWINKTLYGQETASPLDGYNHIRDVVFSSKVGDNNPSVSHTTTTTGSATTTAGSTSNTDSATTTAGNTSTADIGQTTVEQGAES